MKSILFGNGINIELGGFDYTNSSIMKRLFENIKVKNYSAILFNNRIENEDIELIIPTMQKELSRMINGEYDGTFKGHNNEILNNIKKRYTTQTEYFNIGLEDLLGIFYLYKTANGEQVKAIKKLNDGLCWMILDAIYNNGRIQNITANILPKYLSFLREKFSDYDMVFSVNFDRTVEAVTQKKVQYLHGCFDILHEQYNPNTLIGHCWHLQGHQNPVNDGNRHMYCNALLGFTGINKQEHHERMETGSSALDKVIEMYEKGLDVEGLKYIERLKSSPDQAKRASFYLINEKILHPELTYFHYPFKKLEKIEGDLTIIGLSPYNDDHIWSLIFSNNDVKKIVYYYYDDESRKTLIETYNDPRLAFSDVKEFWGA